MSLLPYDVVNVYRDTFDTVIDIYGFDCEIYIPENIEQSDNLDIYNERPELKYKVIASKVFIEWKPETKRLRRLGIFTEDGLPIIAWFKNISELQRNAYIRVPFNYTKTEYGTDEFELVDCVVSKMYNSLVIQGWNISPRRR